MFYVFICIFLVLLYLYGTKNHDYWKKKGIEHEKPLIFFGNSLHQFIEKVSFSERLAKIYKKYPNEKYIGTYNMRTPALIIRDPELIKCVLVNDFKHFCYRGVYKQQTNQEPLMLNLFHADGDTWKLLRQKLTPAFSSGKLKAMFPLIVEKTNNLIEIADLYTKNGDEVDVRDMLAGYTTDIIGAYGFGVETDSMVDENSEFRKIGKRIFANTPRDVLVAFLKQCIPELTQNLHYFSPALEKKFVSLIKEIMSSRNYKPTGRNDFIDILLDLKQKGKFHGESFDKKSPDGSPMIVNLNPSDELLTAQVFVFLAAGFETSSSAGSFLLHMLAFHPEEQTHCQREVDEVLKKYNGILCFEAVKDMKYLEMAFRESLRMFPSPGVLLRHCNKAYTFPGTDLTIDPGTDIFIPLVALHSDEKYFDNPEEFRPSRFHPDNLVSLRKFAYMPFGEGPRACIGERLGLMQSLAGVAALLSKFTVVPSKNSVLVPRVDHTSFLVQIVTGGLPLSFISRNVDNSMDR